MDIMIYDVAGRKIAIRIDFTENTVCKSFFFYEQRLLHGLENEKFVFFIHTEYHKL